MLSNPTAFAVALLPHANSANKQFLEKNWTTVVNREASRGPANDLASESFSA